jgi:ABC-2 type transport system permease protein
MFKKLISFEWYCHTRSIIFYAVFFIFFALGFFVASIGNFSFPGMHRNSPYMITDIIGLLSLAAIFTTTLMISQTFLRENDSRMDPLIYSTAVAKWQYLGSRLLGAYIVNALLFSATMFGMVFGHHMPWLTQAEMGAFTPANYLWPLLVLGIPNILFCTTVLAALAWISRNKIIIYIGGLMIFVLYIIGSVISNSPLLAGASPASPEAMSFVAKLDPFGLSTFFEQTRYWTAFERNTRNLELSGNFLINRLLWLVVSLLLIYAAYAAFTFRKIKSKRQKKEKSMTAVIKREIISKALNLEIQTMRHNLATLKSFASIDMAFVFKGIPFFLIIIILGILLNVEFFNAVDGGARMPESLAGTGLIINVFTEVLPFFTIIVLLFYSSELFRRNETHRIDQLEQATPFSLAARFFSKLVSLSAVILCLITWSMILGILFQSLKGNATPDFCLYASMYYYIGAPMLLIAALFLCIQSFVKNKYSGLAISAVLILLVGTGLGKTAGIVHPLLRFGDAIAMQYFEMNGFDAYRYFFHFKIVYNLGIALVLIGIATAKFYKSRHFNKMVLAGAFLLLTSGSYICYHTNFKTRFRSESTKLEWKINYENTFRKYENMPLPTVTAVKTNIELYPENHSYKVSGSYQLINNTGKSIDSILIYMDKNSQLTDLSIDNAIRSNGNPGYGHYWYKMKKPFEPKDTIAMRFRFNSAWLPFMDHTPFNSIIENGSFIRISNYFPRFGYQSGNETGNKKERLSRHMRPETPLKQLDEKYPLFNYDFITLDAVVSTSGSQRAVAVGDLIKSWKHGKRNYFHYATSRPVPFRFAVSSARYQVAAEKYKGISIEVLYDKRHGRNVSALIASTKKTLDYCQQNFGKYPFKTITYAEISSFAEGFAATAYPGVTYVKEDGGFNGDLTNGNKEDVINQLAGHEMSHQWWATQLSPEQKEGGWLLTETLAQYTELMLYEKAHGQQAMLETVGIHLDLYLSNRAFSKEMPLYRTHYDTPHLPYNKGMVIMHQIRMLIGEHQLNKALKALITNYAYPKNPADARDFINEIYAVSPVSKHAKVNELLAAIVTYSSKVVSVRTSVSGNGKFCIQFDVSSYKYREDGMGVRKLVENDSILDIGVADNDGKISIHSFPIKNNRIKGELFVDEKPTRIIVDPLLKNLDTFPADNEKDLEYR